MRPSPLWHVRGRSLRAEGRRHLTTRTSRRGPELWQVRAELHERHAGRSSLLPASAVCRGGQRAAVSSALWGPRSLASDVGPTARIARESQLQGALFAATITFGFGGEIAERPRPSDFPDRASGILLKRAGRRPSWGLPILLLQQRTG